MNRMLLIAISYLSFSACTPNDAPPTISAAIADVQADLTHAHVVGVAHAARWDSSQSAIFDADVLALQCAQGQSDPVASILSGPISLQLAGNFTQSGGFALTSAGSALPLLAINDDASHGRSQQMTLPVSFIPLSALPDAELARALTNESVLFGLQAKLQDDVVARERANMLADRDALAARITIAIHTFSIENCHAGPVAPFVGLHRPAQNHTNDPEH